MVYQLLDFEVSKGRLKSYSVFFFRHKSKGH